MRQIPAESKSARCQPEETETGEIKKEGLLTMNLPYSVTQKDLFEILLNIAPSRPVFIWGAPGIGKTALVASYAEAVGLPCVSVLGSQLAH